VRQVGCLQERDYLFIHQASYSRMVEKRCVKIVLVGKPEGKRPLGRPGVEGRILRWIFRKWDVGAWTALIWLRMGTVGSQL